MSQLLVAPFDDNNITLNVYLRAGCDCSLNGVSTKVSTMKAFTNIEEAEKYVEAFPTRAEEVVILDQIYDTIRAFPLSVIHNGQWSMFGGNIAVICRGSNFGPAREFSDKVIQIMDRIEG